MELLKTTGEFEVELQNPHFVENEHGLELVVSCVTKNEEYINYHQYFTQKIIASGKNAGRKMWEVSAENCEKLGMTKPFHPTMIQQLEGAKATATVELEKYKNQKGEEKEVLKVKWLNPLRKPSLDLKSAQNIWDSMVGGDKTETKTEEFPY